MWWWLLLVAGQLLGPRLGRAGASNASDVAGGGPRRSWRRSPPGGTREAPSNPAALGSVSAWLSAALLAKPGVGEGGHGAGLAQRVARRRAPAAGGAALVYVPTALERGNARHDTSMSCGGWRETAGCDPHGPLVALAPSPCDTDVGPDRSGYCECRVSGDVRRPPPHVRFLIWQRGHGTPPALHHNLPSPLPL
jgi:hypothetical protein